jgi:glycosyltransferase involved in cell wall biosynthesis
MRILQLSKFYPPVLGGIETVAWELAEGLARQGVQCDVLCSAQTRAAAVELPVAGYDIVRAPALGRVLATSLAPTMPLHLRRMSQHADVLHVHMPDPMAAAAVWLVRPRTPLVVHWHSDVIRQRRALRVYEPLQRWLLARAAAIVVTSPPYADSSEPLRPFRDKISVIPIGISDHRGSACSLRAAELKRRFRGRRLVFALGRMTYYKGFDVLVQAAEQLPEDCAVLIGGEGELLERLRVDVARRGLAGKVHLPGHIPDDELPSHFEACDVFCMASTVRAEAYGVAMLEAMVMGKPVVAMDITGSGVPWVNRHGETGLNVPPGNAGALAFALNQLLANEELRQQLGAAARHRYEAEFGADLMTERLLALYRRVSAA